MRVALFLAASCLIARLGLGAESERAEEHAQSVKPTYRVRTSQRDSPITDHFALRGSYFGSSLKTQLHLDAANGVSGTELNAEHDLGLKSRLNEGRMELIFRLREHHRLRVDYYGSLRDGDVALDRSVLFAGHAFGVGDRVQSELDLRMLGFTYTYSFVRTERFEVGAGLGIHLLSADARGTDLTLSQHAESSGVGAFPTPALDATWAISQRFALCARAQYLSAMIRGINAALGDYHTDLQYRWRRNFEVGLGYEAIHAQLDISRRSEPAGFGLSVHGPELFLRVSF